MKPKVLYRVKDENPMTKVQEFSQYMKEQIEQLAEMDIERAKEFIFKLDPNIGIRVVIEKIEQFRDDDLQNSKLENP